MPVGDEKLLIDAVMSTESLADICRLLNENTSIAQKICNRVQKICDRVEKNEAEEK